MKTITVITQKEVKEIERDRKLLSELRAQGCVTKEELRKEVLKELATERENLNHDIVVHDEEKIALQRRISYWNEKFQKFETKEKELQEKEHNLTRRRLNMIDKEYSFGVKRRYFVDRIKELPFFVKWFFNSKEYENL